MSLFNVGFFKCIISFVLFMQSVSAFAIVDMKNANYSNTWTDAIIAENLRISRTYNSRALHDGIFGFGWCSDFETKIELSGDLENPTLYLTFCGGGQEVELFRGGKRISNEKLIDHRKAIAKNAMLEENIRFDYELVERAVDSSENKRGISAAAKLPNGTYSDSGGTNRLEVLSDGMKLFSKGELNYTFSRLGKLTGYRINQLKSSVWVHLYYADNVLSNIQLDGGELIHFESSASGKVESIRYSDGAITYEYDKTNNLIASNNIWKNRYEYEYDNLHNMVRANYPDDTYIAIGYDREKDWVNSFKNREGCREDYIYNIKSTMDYSASVTKLCNGKITASSFFSFHHLKTSNNLVYLAEVSQNIANVQTTITYNELNGQPKKIRRHNNNSYDQISEFEYDTDGRVTKKISDNRVEEFSYSDRFKGSINHVQVSEIGRDGANKEWGLTVFYDSEGKPARAEKSDGAKYIFNLKYIRDEQPPHNEHNVLEIKNESDEMTYIEGVLNVCGLFFDNIKTVKTNDGYELDISDNGHNIKYINAPKEFVKDPKKVELWQKSRDVLFAFNPLTFLYASNELDPSIAQVSDFTNDFYSAIYLLRDKKDAKKLRKEIARLKNSTKLNSEVEKYRFGATLLIIANEVREKSNSSDVEYIYRTALKFLDDNPNGFLIAITSYLSFLVEQNRIIDSIKLIDASISSGHKISDLYTTKAGLLKKMGDEIEAEKTLAECNLIKVCNSKSDGRDLNNSIEMSNAEDLGIQFANGLAKSIVNMYALNQVGTEKNGLLALADLKIPNEYKATYLELMEKEIAFARVNRDQNYTFNLLSSTFKIYKADLNFSQSKKYLDDLKSLCDRQDMEHQRIDCSNSEYDFNRSFGFDEKNKSIIEDAFLDEEKATASQLIEKAIKYIDNKELKKAATLISLARSKYHEENHIETHWYHYNLLYWQGKAEVNYDKKIRYLKSSIVGLSRKLGEKNWRVTRSREELVSTLIEVHDYTEARKLIPSVMAGAYYSNDPTLIINANYRNAQLLAVADKTDAAIYFGKQAIKEVEKSIGSTKEDDREAKIAIAEKWSEILRNVSGWMMTAGRYSEADYLIGLIKRKEIDDYVRAYKAPINEANATTCSGHECDLEAHQLKLQNSTEKSNVHLNDKLLSSESKQYIKVVESEFRETTLDWQRFTKLVDSELSSQGELGESLHNSIVSRPDHFFSETLMNMGSNVASLRYIVLDKKLYIIFMKADKRRVASVDIDEKSLNGLIGKFLRAIKDSDSDPKISGMALYKILIAPIEHELNLWSENSLNPVLMISPDKALNGLPFSALHDERQFLIEKKYSMTFYNDALIDHLLAKPHAPHLRIFGVEKSMNGNSPLVGASYEIEKIKAIFKDSVDEPYIDNNFKASTLANSFTDNVQALRNDSTMRYSVIHIASHFKFEGNTEHDNGLLVGSLDIGQNDGKAGILSIADMKNYEVWKSFSSDLLTLSACNTASQKNASLGSRVDSFSAVAQQRGARAVLATQWEVNDIATSKLIVEFYKNYFSENANSTKAFSLKNAQLALLRGDYGNNYIEPKYWAGILLMGNWY